MRDKALDGTHPEVSYVLQCCLIHPKHRGSLFLNTADVNFLHKLDWMMGIHLALLEIGVLQAGSEADGWKLEASQYGNCIRFIFLTAKQKELEHLGYTILGVFC